MAQMKLYETSVMLGAHVHAVSSEATGYPAENTIDNNLDTFWKATGTGGSQTIDLDLGEVKMVSACVMFLKNYTTLSNLTIGLYRSSDGSGYTGVMNMPTGNDTTTPIRIGDFSSPQSYRYWRFLISSGVSEVVEVAAVWWCVKYTTAVGPRPPVIDGVKANVDVSKLPGGRRGAKAVNNLNQRYLERQYRFTSTTDRNTLRTPIRASQGYRHPIIINEGSAQNEAIICHVDADEFEDARTDFATVYDGAIRLIEIPYIDDGDVY